MEQSVQVQVLLPVPASVTLDPFSSQVFSIDDFSPARKRDASPFSSQVSSMNNFSPAIDFCARN